MVLFPAMIVHGIGDARDALAWAAACGQAKRGSESNPEGTGVTLLSAPGAALYAGCGWWRALVATARSEYPSVPCNDILDCADATGHALAALRIGVTRLVLRSNAPGRAAVVTIAEAMGGFVLAERPPLNPPVHSALVKRKAAQMSDFRPGGDVRGRSNGDKRRSPG